MMVHIFVEGPTERAALPKVLAVPFASGRLRTPLVLRGARFLAEIGLRAGDILLEGTEDHVFACPDLAPKDAYRNTPWGYEDYRGLQDVLRTQVGRELRASLSPRKAASALDRFHPHPFRHDFEVLLLAWPERLREYLKTDTDITKHYNSRRPEDQDFARYPKKVVQSLFSRFAGRDYSGLYDYPRVFERASEADIRKIEGRCPCFSELTGGLRSLL